MLGRLSAEASMPSSAGSPRHAVRLMANNKNRMLIRFMFPLVLTMVSGRLIVVYHPLSVVEFLFFFHCHQECDQVIDLFFGKDRTKVLDHLSFGVTLDNKGVRVHDGLAQVFFGRQAGDAFPCAVCDAVEGWADDPFAFFKRMANAAACVHT